ncbi:MAG TPA: phosphatase PAP2 family protein [Burkholderiales bacterium]|nr:phosphatase PAP2 family protein [Burkholderiales bacterium]
MNKLVSSLVAAVLVIAVSVRYFDLRIAHFILEYTGRDFQFSHAISGMPDMLLVIVIALSMFSWTGYFLLSGKGISDRRTLLFQVLGSSLPAAYAAKDLLKWLFGRVNTRLWLAEPDAYAFHWFHGSQDFRGFPSGHMLVLTPIFLALCHFSPRFRLPALILWLGMAAALMVTEYHFLGDVIAGGYAGFLIHYAADRYFRRAP